MGGLKISIVLRTYKRNKFFKEALSSISHNNYKNWEVLIFDDNGSSENFNTYLNFKKLHPTNRCVYITSSTSYEFFKQSWKDGVNISTGDICIRLDDDDLLLPYTLKYISDVYNKNKNLDFTYGSSLSFNEDTTITDGISGKSPFESITQSGWGPYITPNNYPWKNNYHWINDYYEHPTKFTSIIHASRANILCVYHLYSFRISSVKGILDNISITSTLCDDLEFLGSMDYLGLSHNSIKDILILNRNHTDDRVTNSKNIAESGLNWPNEIERVRCKVDELRSDGFTSKIIPIEYPTYDGMKREDMTIWIKTLKIESLKF
jgi:glycosyltransferase involved in cell wall biosynthesis